jgi:hypothetical protein
MTRELDHHPIGGTRLMNGTWVNGTWVACNSSFTLSAVMPNKGSVTEVSLFNASYP